MQDKWVLFENNFGSVGIIKAEYFSKYQRENKINWFTEPFKDLKELKAVLNLEDCYEYNMYKEAKRLFNTLYK